MPPDGFTGRVQWGGHSRLGLGLGLGPKTPNPNRRERRDVTLSAREPPNVNPNPWVPSPQRKPRTKPAKTPTRTVVEKAHGTAQGVRGVHSPMAQLKVLWRREFAVRTRIRVRGRGRVRGLPPPLPPPGNGNPSLLCFPKAFEHTHKKAKTWRGLLCFAWPLPSSPLLSFRFAIPPKCFKLQTLHLPWFWFWFASGATSTKFQKPSRSKTNFNKV